MIFNKINIYKILNIIFLLVCAVILALSVKGLKGNPTAKELNLPKWKENGPFELSPERGRFALLYSVAEDNSLQFSKSIANFSMPDLAISSAGRFVSMFTPGVSFLALSGYYLGKYFGIAQVGAFAVIALFALLNIFLIRQIAIKLGANPLAASLGALTFGFATPAFSYAVTLYQHHISTFIVLLSIYILLNWNNWWSLFLVWFLIALSIVVDNPNVFLMLPIAVYSIGRIISLETKEKFININLKFTRVLALAAVVLPLGFLLWFNQASHGDPFKLSGTLVGARTLMEISDTEQTEGSPETASSLLLEKTQSIEKNAVSFFNTRNLTNGFYIHFISPDRGVINYAPAVLIGILGLYFLYKKNTAYANLLTAVIGFNVLLYSMWGDPYGGWAFGSRYLIPAYAILAIALGIILTRWRKNIIFFIIFFLIFNYSATVNTLGALTSIANPPQIEILALEKMSGRVEQYTYERNRQYLLENGSKSFVFQTYFKGKITAQNYYYLVYGLIIAAAAILLLFLKFADFNFNKIFAIIKKE